MNKCNHKAIVINNGCYELKDVLCFECKTNIGKLIEQLEQEVDNNCKNYQATHCEFHENIYKL